MNDIPTPLKHRVPSFKELEIKIETELARQFNFAFPLPDAVKIADTQMLILENTELRPGCALSGIDIDAFDLTGLHGLVDLSPWPPELAKHRFLTRYEELSR